MDPLTNSEMASWNTCHRGWWLRYYRKLNKRRDYPSLPNVGNLYHSGLEAYYRSELTIEPLEALQQRADILIASVLDDDMLVGQVEKDVELAAIMLEGYLEWAAATGADEGFTILGSEMAAEVQVGPYRLRGKIDARLQREADGAKLQLEHKTVANLGDIPKYAQGAPQFLTYDLMAFLLELETGEQLRTDGIILNMARRVKRTARANPPFYARHEVRHNTQELRNHYRHVVAVGKEIETARARLDGGEEHHDVCPPHVDRSHTYSCACKEVTTMFDDGSDVEAFLAEFYEYANPLERYEDQVVEQ